MSEKTNVVGQSVPRTDVVAKVTGAALYPGDLAMPGMLYMKILFAERPHARIVRLDTSRAAACPSVVAVFTARDVPVNEYSLQQPDQPVLCGPGSDKPGAEVVRFIGDQIALVVAETEKAVATARARIRIEFEDLPVVTDPIAAMQPGALLVHPERADTNVCVNYKIRKGDVDAETGFFRLVRVVAADDVGKAINPQLVEGQIEGAVAQAQGYALMEDFQVQDGRVLTDQLSTYLIPTVLDVPDAVESVIVEVPDPRGPWGARGVGELPFRPLAPAIVAAIHDATGVWLSELPATPDRVRAALKAQGG